MPAQLKFTLTLPYPAPTVLPTGSYLNLDGWTYTTPQKRVRLNGTYMMKKYDPMTGVMTINVPA